MYYVRGPLQKGNLWRVEMEILELEEGYEIELHVIFSRSSCLCFNQPVGGSLTSSMLLTILFILTHLPIDLTITSLGKLFSPPFLCFFVCLFVWLTVCQLPCLYEMLFFVFPLL